MNCPIFKPKQNKKHQQFIRLTLKIRGFSMGSMDISTKGGCVRIYVGHVPIGEVLNVWPTWRSPSLGAEPGTARGQSGMGYGTPRVGDPWRMSSGGLGVYHGELTIMVI